MQSFTTQSHQRNYQGNVIFPQNSDQNGKTKHHRGKLISTSILALAIAITSSLLGIMALHNHQLKQELQILRAENNLVVHEESTVTVTAATPNKTTIAREDHPTERQNKTLRRIPVSEQQHETQPMPSICN